MEKVTNLNKKPLIEAIFEVRWELSEVAGPSGSVQSDPFYDVMIGVLLEKLKQKFPIHVRLPAAQVPAIMVPYQVQHQFRASPSGWPLVQLGSGVLTFNDTQGYSSNTFIQQCLNLLSVLQEFWRENSHNGKFLYGALRYINAAALDNTSIEQLLSKLDVHMNLGPRILGTPKLKPNLDAFQLNTRMQSSSPEGFVDLVFNKGIKQGKEALIWETTIFSQADQCNVLLTSPDTWLDQAHKLAEELFFSMIQGELLEKFK